MYTSPVITRRGPCVNILLTRAFSSFGYLCDGNDASKETSSSRKKGSPGPTRVNRWSPSEKDTVYRLYKDKKSIEHIHSRFPTRSKFAVIALIAAIRADHGETGSKSWTTEQLRKLRVARDNGATWNHIQAGAFPDRSIASIRAAYDRYITRQVLPKTKTRPWTEQDQRHFEILVREGKSVEEIKQISFPDFSRMVLQTRSRRFRENNGDSISRAVRWWHVDEEQRLRDLVANSYNVKQIAEMMNRSVQSIDRKARLLGLELIRAARPRRHRVWTAEEIAVLEPTLVMHRPDLSILKEVLPDRSLLQIEVKRARLRQERGITRALKIWSREEVSAICAERAQGLPVADIARRHGRSVNAVSYQLMQERRAQRQLMQQQEEHGARTSPDNTTKDQDTTS